MPRGRRSDPHLDLLESLASALADEIASGDSTRTQALEVRILVTFGHGKGADLAKRLREARARGG